MYQYNQTKYAESVIKNGFSSKYMRMELNLIALYYRELGKTPKERKELIYDVCEKHIEEFNRVKYFKAINSAINFSTNKKNKLIDIDYIQITRSELNYIDNLDIDYLYKKILFTFIVLDKLKQNKGEIVTENKPNGEHYFRNSEANIRELIKSSGITKPMLKKIGHENINMAIYHLRKLGLVEDTINNLKLLFLYNIHEDNNVVMEIRDYGNIGMYYDLHIGKKNIKACENCDKPFRFKSKNKKYCDKCAREKQREWQRISMKKKRCEVDSD